MDHILNSCENRKKGTLRAKETKQGHSYLYAWFTRMRTRKGEEKKYNEINITKKIGFQRSDDINWRGKSWMIYLHSQLEDVKCECIVFSKKPVSAVDEVGHNYVNVWYFCPSKICQLKLEVLQP